MATKQPLIVIVGQTASGKTALAIDIAKKINGEIICADSRTVVQMMDIGTAKPTAGEQSSIPHWGLDLVAPTEQYTAASFQRYVNKKAAEIRERGRVPMLVGGTGLYVDGVIFNYDFPAPMTEKQRTMLETMDQKTLYDYCIQHNIELPENDKNKRHLISSIARESRADRRLSAPLRGTVVYGNVVSTTTLEQRIKLRTAAMFEAGVIDEARHIYETYGYPGVLSFDGVYPGMRDYFDGLIDQFELKRKFEVRDRKLAKRQMTWFRRNPYIQWGTSQDILVRTTDLFTTE